MADKQQELRRAAFAALLKRDRSSPDDYPDDEEAEENPRPYLSGEEEIGRFVAVTLNWSSSDGRLLYLPTYDRLDLAILRAEEYDRDDIYEEIPIKVVDLDEGTEIFANPMYSWDARPSGRLLAAFSDPRKETA